MPKIFPNVIKKKIVRNIVIVSGDAVDRPSVKVDWPEKTDIDEFQSVDINREESVLSQETVTAGILIRDEKEIITDEDLQLELSTNESSLSNSFESAIVNQNNKLSFFNERKLALVRDENAASADEINVEATVTVNDTASGTEDLAIAIIRQSDDVVDLESVELDLLREHNFYTNENLALASDRSENSFILDENSIDTNISQDMSVVDFQSIATVRNELSLSQEDINIVSRVSLEENVSALEEITAAVLLSGEDTDLDSEQQINISLVGYSNAQISNTGFSNPANALGNNTNNSASITASSSGLLGLTSNTTNGTLHLRFSDRNLSDLVITDAVVSVETESTQGGLPLGGGWNVQYQYSINSGSTWTTFYTTNSNENKDIRSTNITSVIAGNWTNIQNFRVRATGSVTSGTGLGATRSALFYRTFLTLSAQRVYL